MPEATISHGKNIADALRRKQKAHFNGELFIYPSTGGIGGTGFSTDCPTASS